MVEIMKKAPKKSKAKDANVVYHFSPGDLSPKEVEDRLAGAYAIVFEEVAKQGLYNKCLCDNPDCVKCLLVNCLDPECKVHSMVRKNRLRNRRNPSNY